MIGTWTYICQGFLGDCASWPGLPGDRARTCSPSPGSQEPDPTEAFGREPGRLEVGRPAHPDHPTSGFRSCVRVHAELGDHRVDDLRRPLPLPKQFEDALLNVHTVLHTCIAYRLAFRGLDLSREGRPHRGDPRRRAARCSARTRYSWLRLGSTLRLRIACHALRFRRAAHPRVL